MMSLLKEINGADGYQENVLNASGAVLVDFWAPWCGPCRMLSKILDELAEEYKGRLQIVKVNVDDNSELAEQHGIMGIPTLKLYQNGQELEIMTGSLPRQTLADKLQEHGI